MEIQSVTLPLALVAGVLSFLSPCVLPLVPVYLGYLIGSALEEKKPRRITVFLHALAFVLGFTLIFVAVFGLPIGFFGNLMAYFTPLLVKIGGALLIVFGLHTTGLVKIPLLYMEKRVELGPGWKPGYLRSLFFGMTFAAGWTRCLDPFTLSAPWWPCSR